MACKPITTSQCKTCTPGDVGCGIVDVEQLQQRRAKVTGPAGQRAAGLNRRRWQAVHDGDGRGADGPTGAGRAQEELHRRF